MQVGNPRLCELTPQERYALQRAAREQMKHRILADIAADLTVCKMEGWDHTEYARDMNLLLSDIVEKFRETSSKRRTS